MKRPLSLLAFAIAASACSSSPSTERAPEGAAGPEALVFAASAEAAAVPRDLLVAIAQVEGGLDVPAWRERVDVDAHVPAAGPLQLRRGRVDTLARGAALAGRSELDLRRDADLALAAGARVLAELGSANGADARDLASWARALEEMSGYADTAHQKEYAHRVFALLARGGTFDGRDGERITIPPHDLPPTLTVDLSSTLRLQAGQPDYPDAQWIPTSCTDKCNTTRYGNAVQYIVVHDTEGGWDASVATLQNDAGKSVQYIVGVDGRVAQFIPESYTGWHSGNSHYNQRSVGIEHVGYANKPFPEPLYKASAKLVAHLASKYGVKLDRAHVIGHDQIPDGGRIASSSAPCDDAPKGCNASGNYGGASNHHDPGVWEWCTFMARVGGTCKCNDVTDLWNCSSSGKQAFRCAAGRVELETCNAPEACEVKPAGQDDVCHTSASPPPPVSGPDYGPPAEAPPAEVAPPWRPAPFQPREGEAGCATSAGSPGGGAWLVGLGLVAAALRRRRSLGRPPLPRG